MKIQITPERKLDDALMIWHEGVNDVDLVLDPRPPYGLKFRPESIESIYAFNIISKTPTKNIKEMISGWYSILKPGGILYVIETDFEYIARAIVGGDLSIEEYNKDFISKTCLSQDLLVGFLHSGGFDEKDQKRWVPDGLKFSVKHYEMIISGIKKQ